MVITLFSTVSNIKYPYFIRVFYVLLLDNMNTNMA